MSATISTMTIHAPCENLAAVTSISTRAVVRAPRPFTAAFSHQRGGRSRNHRRTMLDCESVNEVKTPTA